MAALPEVDPRMLVPDMTERYPKALPTQETAAQSQVGTGIGSKHPLPPAGTEPPKRIKFSHEKPVSFYPGYQGLQYNRRKTNAAAHVRGLLPSIPGQKPHIKLLTAVSNCIIHYGMSDQDTWEIIRDYFNPRCRDKQGKRYPWRKDLVAWAITVAHQEGAYSSLDRIRGEVNITITPSRQARESGLDSFVPWRDPVRTFRQGPSLLPSSHGRGTT